MTDPSPLRQALERLSKLEQDIGAIYSTAELRLWRLREITAHPEDESTLEELSDQLEENNDALQQLRIQLIGTISALLAGERRSQEEPQHVHSAQCSCWIGRHGYGGSSVERESCAVHGLKTGLWADEPASPQEPTALHGELRALLDTAWQRGGPDLYAHVLRIGLREMRKTIEAAPTLSEYP